jgi:putative hydrolase of the HAD superfamily
MTRVILWDFDGTLAERPGLWGACLLETLDAEEPGHSATVEQLRPYLRQGFPWHTPDVAHPELSDPERWWARVGVVLTAAYEGVGIERERAAAIARRAATRYADASHGWRLYPETLAVLGELRGHGWRHAILSNHIPELPALCDGLGLSALIEVVITSAAIGYEKPHAHAFAIARKRCGEPTELWMVGDNPVADVAGAEAVGIPAILVREQGEATRRAVDLHGVATLLSRGA